MWSVPDSKRSQSVLLLRFQYTQRLSDPTIKYSLKLIPNIFYLDTIAKWIRIKYYCSRHSGIRGSLIAVKSLIKLNRIILSTLKNIRICFSLIKLSLPQVFSLYI